MSKQVNKILESLINGNLYLFLQSISAEELKRDCVILSLEEEQANLLLSLQPIARQSSEHDFLSYLKNLNNRALLPIKISPDSPHSSSSVEFSQLIEGKKLALVGPSCSIIGQGLGSKIDSYDYVVRLNFQWPIDIKRVPDLGERIDILYHCCNGDYPIQTLFTRDFSNVKFVCYENNLESKILKRYCDEKEIKNLDITEAYNKLNNKLNCEVNTGTVAISHLMQFDFTELFIAGISFFKEPYYEGYKGHGASYKHWDSQVPPSRIHQHIFEPQLEYCRKLISTNPRVTLDDRLKETLGW